MRIVWKDSKQPKKHNPIKYRSQFVCGSPHGWTTDLPGDNNLYKSHYCALNAIDAALGGAGIRGQAAEKRRAYGIQIIGQKETQREG